ncbi:hypothetical protein L2Y96_12735 [Luteibacter aegosomaticola]|uniref:hypothetical protein n=1 Tax=Luteibacter aegosomaticola TaxID=2911538 RepID=UPI001FFAF3A4|nr:hypothetical protein [Luteibacter aegosomaticola]UPG88286.1 hypothetical protein L2Y96_12735 [Luteibacter aegosomaticola]
MATTRFPRVVGFEVPPLKDTVDPAVDAPIIALLDCTPTPKWAETFAREVTALHGELSTAHVDIEGDRIRFFATASTGRALAISLRSLVERVSRVRLDERFEKAGVTPVGNTGEPTAGDGV